MTTAARRLLTASPTCTGTAVRFADLGLARRCHRGAELGDMCDGGRDQRPSARPGHPSGVPQAVPSPARYDDTVSAQPAEREDPLDPQRILNQLPVSERGFFLDQYREAMENARDPAGWKQLRRVLRLWRFHADAAKDPGYQEALDAARGPVSGGMSLEDAVRVYRPAL
jgi:Family of unknown function (DUF6247)